MKTFFTKLLVVSLICAILIFILCLTTISINNFNFLITEKILDSVNGIEGIMPGIGEYFLIMGGMAFMSDFAIRFLYIFIILIIPSFILLAIIFSQSIARLFQLKSEKKWKNITSKIFTYISLILQFLLFARLFIILSIPNINVIAIFIALFINIFCIVFFIYTLIKLKEFEAQHS